MEQERRFVRLGMLARVVLAAAAGIVVIAAGTASAATPGFTQTERGLASELQKRLLARKVSEATARALAMTYLRRAYCIDVDPADVIVKELLVKERRLDEAQQVQYFAWALDALVRGATPAELTETIRTLLESDYSAKDKAAVLEALLTSASRYASPVAMLRLLSTASNNGVVGKRRTELVQWLVGEVQRGEDPALIADIYTAISAVSPLFSFQQSVLGKYSNAIRSGLSPKSLSAAIVRLAKECETAKALEEALDKLIKQASAGTPVGQALESVLPKKKSP